MAVPSNGKKKEEQVLSSRKLQFSAKLTWASELSKSCLPSKLITLFPEVELQKEEKLMKTEGNQLYLISPSIFFNRKKSAKLLSFFKTLQEKKRKYLIVSHSSRSLNQTEG